MMDASLDTEIGDFLGKYMSRHCNSTVSTTVVLLSPPIIF